MTITSSYISVANCTSAALGLGGKKWNDQSLCKLNLIDALLRVIHASCPSEPQLLIKMHTKVSPISPLLPLAFLMYNQSSWSNSAEL